VKAKLLIGLVIVWAAMSFLGTLMPLPDELQIFAHLPNKYRWFALLIVFLGIFALRYPSYFTLQGLKHVLGIGISWHKENWYFLGMTGSANPDDIRITGFQYRGFNNARCALVGALARLVCNNGREVPLLVTTSNGAMDHAPRVDVDPRTTIYVNGVLGSMRPNEFKEQYGPFVLHFKWQGGHVRIKFSARQIDKQIERFRQETRPKRESFAAR
jgi:hypothetical protein